MAQSLAQLWAHIIFSTKQRYPFLTPEVRPELHAYAATVLKTTGSLSSRLTNDRPSSLPPCQGGIEGGSFETRKRRMR